jgi:hypothetical protein
MARLARAPLLDPERSSSYSGIQPNWACTVITGSTLGNRRHDVDGQSIRLGEARR